MKKELEKIKNGLSCITLISAEEYAAAQRSNNIALIIKIAALLILIGLFLYALKRFKSHKRPLIIGFSVLFLTASSILVWLNLNPVVYKNEYDAASIYKEMKESSDEMVEIGCGENLIKKWWEF